MSRKTMAVGLPGEVGAGDPRELRSPSPADASSSPREVIIARVLDGLYKGRYRPGGRLVEAQLATSFGVSRGSVREAFNQLAAIGVLSLTPQRGAEVRKLTVSEAVDTLEVFRHLLSFAARLAAERGDPAAPEMLGRALEQVKKNPTYDRSVDIHYAQARDELNMAIARLSGNYELNRILPTIQIHLIRVQFGVVTKVIDRYRYDDYRRIVRSILGGQPAQAERAVRQHLNRGIEIISSLEDE